VFFSVLGVIGMLLAFFVMLRPMLARLRDTIESRAETIWKEVLLLLLLIPALALSPLTTIAAKAQTSATNSISSDQAATQWPMEEELLMDFGLLQWLAVIVIAVLVMIILIQLFRSRFHQPHKTTLVPFVAMAVYPLIAMLVHKLIGEGYEILSYINIIVALAGIITQGIVITKKYATEFKESQSIEDRVRVRLLTLATVFTQASHFLVTGGVGMIGVHLVRTLLRAGHEVTIIDNMTDKPYGREQQLRNLAALESIAQTAKGQMHFVEMDLRDRNGLNSWAAEKHIDNIVIA